MAINPDGNVYPCPFFINLPEFCGGNIVKDNIAEIWSKSRAFNNFRKILVSVGEKIKEDGVPSEMHGCRRIALHNGDISSIDPIS